MSRGALRCVGAVLAGGESRRYGRDKASAPLGGRPMSAWAAGALRPHVDDLVLVGGGDELAAELGVEAVPDRRPGRGPLAGLEAALERARVVGAPGAFVLACDLPLVSPALVERILRAAGEGARATVPEAPGPLGVQPLCAYWPAATLPAVRELLEEVSSSMGDLVDEVRPRRLPLEAVVAVGDPATLFLNVNTPDDRARVEELLAARRAPGLRGEDAPATVPAGEGAPPIVSVVGWKDSGKTGLVVRLAEALTARGRRVMTLKHGHGFELDTPGTDSWRHRMEGGAERVVLAGPEEMAVLGRWGPDGEPGPAALAARYLGDAEIVVAEGWKRAALPKIEVLRADSGEGPIYDPEDERAAYWVALVTDRDDLSLPIPVLALDDPELADRLADMVEATLLDAGGPEPAAGGGDGP